MLLSAAVFVIYSNSALKDKVFGIAGQKQAEKEKIIVSKKEAAKLVKDTIQIFALSIN